MFVVRVNILDYLLPKLLLTNF